MNILQWMAAAFIIGAIIGLFAEFRFEIMTSIWQWWRWFKGGSF